MGYGRLSNLFRATNMQAKLRHFLILFVLFVVGHRPCFAAFEWQTGYEPLLVKQYNGVDTLIYQSGVSSGGSYKTETINLWFHMAFLKVQNFWDLPSKNLRAGITAGISAAPLPVRRIWTVPSLDSTFTGIVTSPTNGSDSYWNTHRIDYALNNQERYLIEETSLVVFPLQISLAKSFLADSKFNFLVGATAGIQTFYFSTQRNRLSGNPPGRFSSSERSMTHITRTLGGVVGVEYPLTHLVKVFADFNMNAVGNLSNYQIGDMGSLDGYRFDGLRYNAKLGVSWKI
mgnify:CR=1 FL=1